MKKFLESRGFHKTLNAFLRDSPHLKDRASDEGADDLIYETQDYLAKHHQDIRSSVQVHEGPEVTHLSSNGTDKQKLGQLPYLGRLIPPVYHGAPKVKFEYPYSGERYVILYHDNCTDGAIAAALAWDILTSFYTRPSMVSAHPVRYGDAPPAVAEDAFVVIVDFSYPPDVLAELIQKCKHVTLIDHHHSAVADLFKRVDGHGIPDDLHDGLENLELFAPLERDNDVWSGAGLVLEYFSRWVEENIAWKTMYVRWHPVVMMAQRYDLWHHDGDPSAPETALNAYVQSQKPKEKTAQAVLDYLDLLAKLLPFHLDYCLRDGHNLMASEIGEVTRLIDAQYWNWHRVDGVTFPVLSLSAKHANLGSTLLRKRYVEDCRLRGVSPEPIPFSVTWHRREDGSYKYSFRSSKAAPYDVDALARRFGGGGHETAAGLQTELDPIALFGRPVRQLLLEDRDISK